MKRKKQNYVTNLVNWIETRNFYSSFEFSLFFNDKEKN